MEKNYNPTNFESRLYSWWEKSGFFKASDTDPKPSFTIMIPPPNVTGALHNGHALFLTIQDMLIRWKRMSGFNTLWLPGMDHAGIATQMVVERELAKEKTNRHTLGRKAFIDRVWQWKEKHGGLISNQMRVMGASVDWERERFTMDEGLSQAVRKVFVKLYNEKLIYRGSYIINWCIKCQTALSDLEVIGKERKGHLWQIAYKVKNSKEVLTIATTRPETFLGDTAIAVNPKDERYKHLIGKEAELPLTGRAIPIIGDDYVDMEFGTGALKVTPGHDFNDYEIGKRHSLPSINIFTKEGTLNENAGIYKDLKISQAREQILKDLEEKSLLIKTMEHTNQVSTCERCETVLEPMVSDQWFVKAEVLAKPAVAAVGKGEKISGQKADQCTDAVKIYPESWNATFYHFMNNIRDWCISRQLWWGHRIPAWHCGDCRKISVSETDLSQCPHCKNAKENFFQEDDVLDTWFSSALWPFSTLGWPEKTKALQKFYPGHVLETGTDILFFWVARMIMMGMHFMDGKVPFHRVYLHSLVRDEKGQKMSKTKGNVIDPLVVVQEHGADAFRFTLISMAGPNRDIRLSLDRVALDKAFCNKLWNASRYCLMRFGVVEPPISEETGKAIPGIAPANGPVNFEQLTQGLSLKDYVSKNFKNFHPVNRWIISQFQKAVEKSLVGLEEFRLNETSAAIYNYIWNDFCDWYIEYSKVLIQENEKTANESYLCLLYGLENILKLAHPVIPFITEEIFQNLPTNKAKKTLMLENYPAVDKTLIDEGALQEVQIWTETIYKIRAFRGENNIPLKARPQIYFEMLGGSENKKTVLEKGRDLIISLAQIESFTLGAEKLKNDPATGEILTSFAKLFIPLTGLVDFEAEKKRLDKELQAAIKDVDFFIKKLGNESFISKAPPELVAEQKEKLKKAELRKEEILGSIDKIKNLT